MGDEDAPITKKDLLEFEERLTRSFDGSIKTWEDRLSKQMRDMQTELLKALRPGQDQVRIQFRKLNPPAA